MREGDIEAIRSRAKEEGRSVKSNLIRDKDGNIISYTVKNGKVKINDKDN